MGWLAGLTALGSLAGGLGGGKKKETTRMPKWLEDQMQQGLDRAAYTSSLGFTPYFGPDVAGFTPMQEAAFKGTNQAAAAFGMPATSGAETVRGNMPRERDFGGGMTGYSSGDIYMQALKELERRQPGQYAALTRPFFNPVTGAAPTAFGTPDALAGYNVRTGRTAAPAGTQTQTQTQNAGAQQGLHPMQLGMNPGDPGFSDALRAWRDAGGRR